jgi:hypothetical protein
MSAQLDFIFSGLLLAASRLFPSLSHLFAFYWAGTIASSTFVPRSAQPYSLLAIDSRLK